MKAASVGGYSQRLPNADQVCYGCKSTESESYDYKMLDEYENENLNENENDYYGMESDYFGGRRNYRALEDQNVRTDLDLDVRVDFRGTTSDIKVFEFMPADGGENVKKYKFMVLEDVEFEGLLYVEYYKQNGLRFLRDTGMTGFSERNFGMKPYAVLYMKYSKNLPEKLRVRILGFEENDEMLKSAPVSFEFDLTIDS